jgi:shikimate kinase
MMGAGKSSVGRCLQQRTGLIRFDIDEMIVAKAGLPITEIFASQGETHFRNIETAVLNDLHLEQPVIIVTGGGIVLRPGNVERLKQLGTIVWLDAAEQTLLERASRRGDRPLLRTEDPRATLSDLIRARAPLYASAADLRIDTTHLTHDEVADAILEEIEKRILAEM